MAPTMCLVLYSEIRLYGQGSAVLTISAVEASDSAWYDCVITSPVGEIVTSNSAYLDVREVPTLLLSPTDVSVIVGQNATFEVVAINNNTWGLLSVQWKNLTSNQLLTARSDLFIETVVTNGSTSSILTFVQTSKYYEGKPHHSNVSVHHHNGNCRLIIALSLEQKKKF
jgi:hypothetical protein